jgi:hypothetical protein
VKKDLLVVLVVALLGLTAFLVSSEPAPAAPQVAQDPYAYGDGKAVEVRYKAEGGLSPVSMFEATVRGPGQVSVRYEVRGRRVVARTHPISETEFRNLMAALARVDFLEVESVPRSNYLADMPSTTLAAKIGEAGNSVTIDGRRRASRDLGPVLTFFEGVRRTVTPEGVGSGD